MTDTQSMWLTGPIAVVGFVLMLVFLSGCASPRQSSTDYRRFVKANCEVCGTAKGLEGCHSIPKNVIQKRLAKGEITQAEADYLINDAGWNFRTLCRGCHGYVQHIGNNFKRWNANVIATIKSYKEGVE